MQHLQPSLRFLLLLCWQEAVVMEGAQQLQQQNWQQQGMQL